MTDMGTRGIGRSCRRYGTYPRRHLGSSERTILTGRFSVDDLHVAEDIHVRDAGTAMVDPLGSPRRGPDQGPEPSPGDSAVDHETVIDLADIAGAHKTFLPVQIARRLPQGRGRTYSRTGSPLPVSEEQGLHWGPGAFLLGVADPSRAFRHGCTSLPLFLHGSEQHLFAGNCGTWRFDHNLGAGAAAGCRRSLAGAVYDVVDPSFYAQMP